MIDNAVDTQEDASVFDNRPYGANPVRTCVACGRKDDKDNFLRYALSPDDKLICDVRKKIQSRGVYVCADKSCITKALKKRCFSRFLRKQSIEPSFELLAGDTANGYEAYVYSIMNMALKSGKLVCGHTSVFHMSEKGTAKLLLLASDAGGSIESKVKHLSEKKGISLITIGSKQEIADKLSIEQKSVMAVCANSFADSIFKSWQIFNDVKVWLNGENKWQ